MSQLDDSEHWRPVVGWEGLYEVSDQGRVRSLDRTFTTKTGRTAVRQGRLLKPYRTTYGRRCVVLCAQDRMNPQMQVHRLILTAFVGDAPEGKPFCCHRDGNPENNHIDNLYWGDPTDNAMDMVRHGRGPKPHPERRRSHCREGHKLEGANLYITSKGHPGCRQCRNEKQQAKRALKRLAVSA